VHKEPKPWENLQYAVLEQCARAMSVPQSYIQVPACSMVCCMLAQQILFAKEAKK